MNQCTSQRLQTYRGSTHSFGAKPSVQNWGLRPERMRWIGIPSKNLANDPRYFCKRREVHWVRIAKFRLKKLNTSFHGMVQSIFRYLEPFQRDSRVWQTDRHSLSKCRHFTTLSGQKALKWIRTNGLYSGLDVECSRDCVLCHILYTEWHRLAVRFVKAKFHWDQFLVTSS